MLNVGHFGAFSKFSNKIWQLSIPCEAVEGFACLGYFRTTRRSQWQCLWYSRTGAMSAMSQSLAWLLNIRLRRTTATTQGSSLLIWVVSMHPKDHPFDRSMLFINPTFDDTMRHVVDQILGHRSCNMSDLFHCPIYCLLSNSIWGPKISHLCPGQITEDLRNIVWGSVGWTSVVSDSCTRERQAWSLLRAQSQFSTYLTMFWLGPSKSGLWGFLSVIPDK